jgi:hypothetical protein
VKVDAFVLVTIRDGTPVYAKTTSEQWRLEMNAKQEITPPAITAGVAGFLLSSLTPTCAQDIRWRKAASTINTGPLSMVWVAHGQPRHVVRVLAHHQARNVFANAMKSSVAGKRYLDMDACYTVA